MRTSEQIKELAAALAKAQGEIRHAVKDANNPHFKSKYADLASVVDAARAPLAAAGLSIVQAPEQREAAWVLVTRLLHSSGEWVESDVPILLGTRDAGPQPFGSALTYARRYGFAAIVGIAPDDDDGEGAQRPTEPRRALTVVRSAEPAPTGTPPATLVARISSAIDAAKTIADLGEVPALGRELGAPLWDPKDPACELCNRYRARYAALGPQPLGGAS